MIKKLLLACVVGVMWFFPTAAWSEGFPPEAVTIIVNGFLVVCFIMAGLATITWAVGKVVQHFGEEAKEE